jgi:hypothetical protein
MTSTILGLSSILLVRLAFVAGPPAGYVEACLAGGKTDKGNEGSLAVKVLHITAA